MTERPPSAASDSSNPWHFLTALDGGTEADRQLVETTRRDEIQLILHMVAAARVSILYSYSGNGKSSIVNAGLIPFLIKNHYAVFRMRPRPPWSVDDPTQAFKECILRDINLPLVGRSDVDVLRRAKDGLANASQAERDQFDRLLARLEAQVGAGSNRSASDSEAIRAELKQHISKPLAEFIGQIQARLDATTTLVFICDQFEELFVHFGDTPAMDEFVTQIGSVWADDSLRVRLLFSMREDWVGSMIEFRRAIPDIFRDTFKLKPITRSCAGHVLTMPLQTVGHSIEPATVDTILKDLADSYRNEQENRASDVSLTLSPKDDPFIELPALQVVADRLWITKDKAAKPFSLAHYQRLTRDGQRSPAAAVLDDYLDDFLRAAKTQDDLTDSEWLDLRLDCLYLLTDRVRHRRALPANLLREELRKVRQNALNLPEVTAERLKKALEPLETARLVRVDISRTGQPQYELAHDFAVRSVVARWRRLDRERTAALAVHEEIAKRAQVKVSALEDFDQRVKWFLREGPLSACALAILMTTAAWAYAGVVFGFGEWTWRLSGSIGLASVGFVAVLTVAGLRRHWPGVAIGAVGTALSLGFLLNTNLITTAVSLLAVIVPLQFWSLRTLRAEETVSPVAQLGRVRVASAAIVAAAAWWVGSLSGFQELRAAIGLWNNGYVWLCGLLGGAGTALGLHFVRPQGQLASKALIAAGWTVAMAVCGYLLHQNSFTGYSYTGYASSYLSINLDAVLGSGLVAGLIGGVVTGIALKMIVPAESWRSISNVALIWAVAIGVLPLLSFGTEMDQFTSAIGPVLAGACAQLVTVWTLARTPNAIGDSKGSEDAESRPVGTEES